MGLAQILWPRFFIPVLSLKLVFSPVRHAGHNLQNANKGQNWQGALAIDNGLKN
jgi:hypothetical protein